MSTIDIIITALKDHVAATALRDQIIQLDKEIKALTDRNMYLEKKTADLIRENEALKNEAATQRMIQNEFTEYRGAYFKRLPGGGGYSDTIYCPVCLGTMWSFEVFPYECSACKHVADFSKNELSSVLLKLGAE